MQIVLDRAIYFDVFLLLDFEDLKKMGVVLKRALYFITCKGKMMYPIRMDEDYITRNLLNTKEKLLEAAEKDSIKTE